MAHLPAKTSPTHYGTASGEIGELKGWDGVRKSLQRQAGVKMEVAKYIS